MCLDDLGLVAELCVTVIVGTGEKRPKPLEQGDLRGGLAIQAERDQAGHRAQGADVSSAIVGTAVAALAFEADEIAHAP